MPWLIWLLDFEYFNYITSLGLTLKRRWRSIITWSLVVGLIWYLIYLIYWRSIIWSLIVMPQFNWLHDVCGCVMSPTSGIYWVELGFINNYNKPQLWLVFLRYSVNVASAFLWVVTYSIRAGPVILCGLRDTTPQYGS